MTQYLKICPKCGSTNIGDNTINLTISGPTFTPYCKDCNYGLHLDGIFPEIQKTKIKQFQNQLKHKK